MKIYVLGPGCSRCQQTERNVFNACAELDLAADISKITDVKQFSKYGVVMTPAVVVNNRLVVSGKIPTVDELKELLKKFKEE